MKTIEATLNADDPRDQPAGMGNAAEPAAGSSFDDPQALKELDRPASASAAPPGHTREPDEPTPTPPAPAARRPARHPEPPKNLYDRIEAFISRLSVRDNFWHSICSLIWLPLAFFSGIRMRAVDSAHRAVDSAKGAMDSAKEAVTSSAFAAKAVLPFRRFNRNWYRAMAGGALLANSEIAGGMYVFGIVGGDYTVVCKHLEYRFLRPCLGPAVYHMKPRENVPELVATGGEFNVTLDLDVLQQASRMGERDKRVGQCVATFHVTPKVQHKVKRLRRSK
jgi:hypothetical protein